MTNRSRPGISHPSFSRAVLRFPAVREVGAFALDNGSELRLTVRQQHGRDFLDVRIYFSGFPSRQGFSLWPDEVPALAALLSRTHPRSPLGPGSPYSSALPSPER